MSTMEQVEQNIKTASAAKANSLTESEKETIKQVAKIYKNRIVVNCTNCKYCMPCPVEVDIPGNFEIYNNYTMFDNLEKAKGIFNWIGKDASHCVECGACESQCPQNIEIIKHLADMVDVFDL